MNRITYLIPVFLMIVMGLVFYVSLDNSDESDLPSALIGKTMPTLPETGLSDYQVGDLQQLISDNNVILVNFFASWCAPCRAEHPNLVALKESGVVIIGVNYMDKVEPATKFIAEKENPYAAIRTDPEGKTGIEWGVAGVPETFFVNSKGIILKRFLGPITKDALENEVIPFINAQ